METLATPPAQPAQQPAQRPALQDPAVHDPAVADPEAYEHKHVHDVYEQIADHFSETRHKPWPIVEAFLTALPAGAVGLDIGCGNGKNLGVRRDIVIIGSDRSGALAARAARRPAHEPHGAVVADARALPHRARAFDFALCVAVLHHLATGPRRVAALAAVLAVLRADATALVCVWALEQRGSRRGWGEGDAQDVLVPWVRRAADGGGGERTFQRYYHLYRQGELEDDVRAANGTVVESGYEKDNWWAVIQARPED